MKVLHLPYSWRPRAFGGTEHYVLGLWRSLRPLGVGGLVASLGAAAAPEGTEEPECESFEDVDPPGGGHRDELYGDGSTGLAESLAGLASRREIDLVHFHARTRFASTSLARLLGERSIPYVYTFHTPTTVCRRGDLRFEGGGACDGRMEGQRCSACWLQSRGFPPLAARALARMDLPALPTGVGGLVGARRLTSLRAESVSRFLRGAAGVVALCAWGREVLLRNGVPDSRLVLSRHGLDDALLDTAERAMARRNDSAEPVPEFVFVGRADRLKGADLFVEAVRRLPGLALRATLIVVVQGPGDEELLGGLRRLAGGDERIRFESEVPRDAVLRALSRATACVVPSRWLETGPLVVLESFAVGTPVIGTNLGGIAELVKDGVDGILFELEDVDGLARSLARLAADGDLREKLRAGVSKPRSMSLVAAEMKTLYENVLGARG